MPAIYKNILDFEILDIDNPKILVFLDASEYMDERPEKPLLEVTLPGFTNYHIVNITPRQINVFNANTLGITASITRNYNQLVDLPDGVYAFTYRICPYDKVYCCKTRLRTTQLNMQLKCLYKLIENADCSLMEDRKLKNKLMDIEQFIATAKAYAEDGDVTKASNFYQIAAKFTNDLTKKLTNKC